MSKFTPIAVVIGGTGGVLGSYHSSPNFQPKKKIVNPKLNVRFKDKYKTPLLDLNGDEEIWNTKWNLLKDGKPTHPKLLKAKETNTQQQDSKKLHKEGCKDIYDSATMATPYFLDFKYYCSKTNKDVIKGDWISEDTKNPKTKNEWDEPLKDLSSATEKDLVKELLELFKKIKKDTKTPSKFDENHREKLKEWCDLISEGFYLGEGLQDVENAKKFCLKKVVTKK
ncbi:hypothetical protein MHC_01405 [Mycoplasma haemocanis str. Illinois]|uniref:Uncharacterized protein n=1 Tax=Mycoplasma haemocanis (strain Illinois) TaxID=1111676 RepID=H6N675_MYCHN|nr:hypothetical protein [Mycoplasma haemocanis]AEW45147.1 hypothetical protein MHC_01405 [Mycoplasma haemocanis str. Illinois]